MSNIVPYQTAIQESRSKFVEIMTKSETAVTFEVESMFALQSLSKNAYLAGIANKSLTTLQDAIVNVASIGLSLNPITQYAYLVPRDGAICLDISYKGLIKLATDSGSILWAKADLVYKNDVFKYLGPSKIPDHTADIFGTDRGEFVGCYCIAKTCDGDFLIEVMNAKEIEQVKSASKTTKENTPWRQWFGEMAKKTIIKRASKTWPRSDKNERLAKAITVLNSHEGTDFDIDITGVELISQDQVTMLQDEINDRGVDKEKFLAYVGVSKLEDLEQSNFQKALSAVQQKPKKDMP